MGPQERSPSLEQISGAGPFVGGCGERETGCWKKAAETQILKRGSCLAPPFPAFSLLGQYLPPPMVYQTGAPEAGSAVLHPLLGLTAD